jgi:hypothetical protein
MSEFVPNYVQKRVKRDVNKWIKNWLSPLACGVMNIYRGKDDLIIVDVETTDGGVSAMNYLELYCQAAKHNFEYITVDEFCECYY